MLFELKFIRNVREKERIQDTHNVEEEADEDHVDDGVFVINSCADQSYDPTLKSRPCIIDRSAGFLITARSTIMCVHRNTVVRSVSRELAFS